MRTQLVRILQQLSNATGVAGREDAVRALMMKLLKPSVDEVRQDRLGNVIGIKWGKTESPKIMLAAHMDEIGLMVKNINEEGFLQFSKIGGIDDRILVAQKMTVHTETGSLVGIIGSKPPHILKEDERKKIIEADSLFIDVGAKNKQDAQKMGIRIGDVVSFAIRFSKIRKDVVVGKAFDDRVGCAVLIATMSELPKVDCTVSAVGTIQEEVGLRGATTAAFHLHPDVGIALEATVAGDIPGVKDGQAPAKMGGGPTLTVADAGLITHPKILKLFIDAAQISSIPYQFETGIQGTTDAARIALTREGVPCGVLSVPTRYIHSPASMLHLKDVRNTVKLAIAVTKLVPKYFTNE